MNDWHFQVFMRCSATTRISTLASNRNHFLELTQYVDWSCCNFYHVMLSMRGTSHGFAWNYGIATTFGFELWHLLVIIHTSCHTYIMWRIVVWLTGWTESIVLGQRIDYHSDCPPSKLSEALSDSVEFIGAIQINLSICVQCCEAVHHTGDNWYLSMIGDD